MSEADGVKAEINVAIDLQEKASIHISETIEAINQLQAQLLVLGIQRSQDSNVSGLVSQIQAANQVSEGVAVVLHLVRDGLDEWRDRL